MNLICVTAVANDNSLLKGEGVTESRKERGNVCIFSTEHPKDVYRRDSLI